MRTDYKTRILCTILTICMVLTGTPYSYENQNVKQVFASESTEPELSESEITASDITVVNLSPKAL